MKETLRILILEDRPADAELVTRELRKAGFEFAAKVVATEEEFLAELRDSAPHLILADYSLPGYSGLAALASAQQQCPETPFIFVSGSLGEEKAIETLHRGATDYVLKQRLARLEPAVRRALREREEMRKREQAEKERHEAEARYRALFEHSPDGIVILDPETARPVGFNAAAHRQLGYTREEFARLSLADIEANETLEQTRAAIDGVQREGRKDFETWQRTREGQIRHVHVTAQTVDVSGRSVYHCVWRDITERKQAEQRICELNLMVKASGAINALMVRERDPQRLLDEACKILVETRGYQFVWIGQVEPGSKRVVPAAHAGNESGYLDAATITWDETPTGQGPIGTAMRTGQPAVCQDTATDPSFAPWREAAMARGFASLAAMPMIHGSRVLGAVAVYSARTGAFNAEELELLKELAGDLAFALQSIEHERERRWAEESLGENERRYRLLFNSGYDAVFVHQGGTDGKTPGKFIEVNDIACQRLGYSREELLQMTPQDISAPETLPDLPGIRAKLAVDRSAVYEGVHIAKDGRRIPVEISTHVFELNGKPTRLSAVRDITERKKGEEALRRSELFAKSVLNALTSHIAVVDAHGTILEVNDAWRRFARENGGRDPAAYVGANYLAVCQASIRRGEDALAEAALRGLQAVLLGEREEFLLEYPCHSPDEQRWFNLRATRFPGEGIARIVVAHENITARKRAELRTAAFSNLGQRLNSAKNAREAGEIIVGVADELFGWDACVFDLYSAAENRISHVLNMDLVDGRRTECKQRYASASPREFSKRAIEQGGQLILRDDPSAVRPEGSPFGDISRPSASLMFVPVRHGTEVVGVLSIQSYTSGAYDAYSLEVLQALADYAGGALERLRAQEAMAESEAHFRSVWERSIDGMRLADKEGRIIAVNEAFCRLVKLPREKLEGQIISVAYKGQGPNDGIEVYQKRFATGGISPRDTRRVQLWNSDEVDLEISNSFIELGQRGKLLLSIFRDVSERRRDELRIAAFANLGQRLNAAKTAKAAGEIIVSVADELLGWDSCLFDLYSAADNRMSYVLSMDVINGQRTECNRQYPNRLPTGTARQAIEQGGQLILRDHPQAMRPEGVPFGDTSRPSASILFVPIRHGTAVVGILSIQSYTPGAYNAQSLEALQALADYAGGAVERIRAEEALRASEQEFHSLAEAMPQIVWVTRPDGWNTYFNQQWVDYTGLKLEESYGHGWNTPFHPDDRQRAWDAWQRATQHNDPYVLECRLRRADGAYRWWLIRGVPVRNASGEILKWFGTCTDIEDIKQAQAALQRERHTAQRYLDIAGAMIVAVDPNQKVLLANRKTCEILACAESDLIGRNWFDTAIPEPGRDQLKAGFGEMMAGKMAPWEYVEGPILTPGGKQRLIAWHNTLLRDETGRVIATLSSGEDITERKALEAQLRQAQKMEAVGQLAGGVAHDFNNMLAVIRGNAELLLMDEDQHTAPTREGLKHVVEASERAANLTRQLLTFSRKQVMQAQPLLLNEVITNLTKMLHRVISENIDLQCQYATSLPFVQADTGMMEQVILNLVVNARDAMPHGGQLRVATELVTLGEAHARLNPEARAGEFVCMRVSDTGTGIAPEVLPRIFEPFFTTKEVGKGTGLGLATVYGIVQQHQGWIEVSSQTGEGSTFKVFLPAIATSARPAAAAVAGTDIRGGKETILLVEDEHSVRVMTRRVLEGRGYTIWEATSGREALEVWQSHAGEIALLLTDIIMPGEMTGRDLAERLWVQRPGLKVIFMSGYSADILGKGTEFIRRTKSRFLQKPSSSQRLLDTVRQCLDEKEPEAAPGEASPAK